MFLCLVNLLNEMSSNHSVIQKRYYVPPLQGNLKIRPDYPAFFPGYSVTEFSLHALEVELSVLKVLKLFPFFPVPDPIAQQRIVHLRGCLCSRASAPIERINEIEFEIVVDKNRCVYCARR
jgi:hypothetical protein